MGCSDEVLVHHIKLISNDVGSKICIRMAQEALPIRKPAGSLPVQMNSPNARISDATAILCNSICTGKGLVIHE